MFRDVIIAIFATIAVLQTGFFKPESPVQAVIIAIVLYAVFTVSLTWADCQWVAKREREKKNPQEAGTSQGKTKNINK